MNLPEMKKLCEAATQEPWQPHCTFEDWFCVATAIPATPIDMHFIAAARSFVPEAIREIERLRKELAWYGDKGNYQPRWDAENDPIGSAIFDDEGQIARDALKGDGG
jgi:hypothetical protein